MPLYLLLYYLLCAFAQRPGEVCRLLHGRGNWLLGLGSPAAWAQAAGQADPVLSRVLVEQLIQDPAGFFWVVPEDELYRYDGYQLVSLNELLSSRPRLPAGRYYLAWGADADLGLLDTPGLYRYDTPRRRLSRLPLPTRPAGDYPATVPAADPAHDCLWQLRPVQRWLASPPGGLGEEQPFFPQGLAGDLGWVSGGWHVQLAYAAGGRLGATLWCQPVRFTNEVGYSVPPYYHVFTGVTCLLPQQPHTLAHVTYPATGPMPALELVDDALAAIELALTDSASPRYWYRLRGYADSAWRCLPHRHQLRLTSLPPGSYLLLVRAESGRGQPAFNVLQLSVQVQHTWWRSPQGWLLPAGALFAGGLAYGWLLQRRYRCKRQRLRRQLAHDLHDELGGLLVRAALQAELLQEQPAISALHAELRQNLRAAAQAVRDVAWGADPEVTTLGDLLDRLRAYLAQTAHLTGRPAELWAAGLPEGRRLPQPVRQHVYFIVKEALTNVLRHAPHYAHLTVSCILTTRHRLVLTVRNDGHSPAPDFAQGMGLRSMRRRADLLGGQLQAGAQPGGYFQVRLTVPL